MKDKRPKSPICFDCGKLKGGIMPENSAVTCTREICVHCNKPKTCPSVSDFDWPKLGIRAIWD